jgi:gas vesicle protein
MNAGKTMWGALGLFAGGAVIGMLFAPAKGKDTRKKIADTTTDYADELKHRVNHLMENFTDSMEIVKEEADKLTRKLKH